MLKHIKSELNINFREALKKTKNINELHRQILGSNDVKNFLNAHKKELTEENIERSFSKLYEYVSEKKRFSSGSHNYIAKGFKPKLVLSNKLIDVVYEPTKALILMQKEAEIKSRIKALNMPRDVRKASFKNLQLSTDSKRIAAIKKVKSFVENFVENPNIFQKGLYLYGNFGIGKSFLMYALANELALKGFTTTIIHFPSFLSELKGMMGASNVNFGATISNIEEAEILILDDLGAESVTAWSRDDILLNILQHRMQEKLITMFTSNRDFKSLEEHLRFDNKGNDEPIQARRIMERFRYLSEEVLYKGENLRNGSN